MKKQRWQHLRSSGKCKCKCHSAELHLVAEHGENEVMATLSFLLTLIFLFTSTAGAQQLGHKAIWVRPGEMAALHCPCDFNHNGDATHVWTSLTKREMDLTNVSSAEQMGVLVLGMSLVILRASGNHQGNYSCSLGNSSCQSWFTVTVSTAQPRGHSQKCNAQQSCILKCPDENSPRANMTSNGIKWHKEGESSLKDVNFPSVGKNQSGVYTCTRSFLYKSHVYNMTSTFELHVEPTKKMKTAVITSPRHEDVFYVDLGSTKVIDCEAVTSLDFDDLFWLNEKSSNTKRVNNGEQIKMTASLVFGKVSDEDLSKNYTCKLQSAYQSSSIVTITLRKAPRSYTPLTLSTVGLMVVMMLTVFVCVMFKIEITLFLRDTLGCHRRTSDGKCYDAFMMCYKSDADVGLNAQDRKWLESVLEERFGYSLCLYDRDVLPGKPVAEAVIECIEESRTVVLVPTSPDPGLGSGLLTAIHASLVERQTRLIFISTETTKGSMPGSLPEALQLLNEAGDCVTWKGPSSMSLSSSFWKQLRYYLPPCRPKVKCLPLKI
nr:PREDICTED: interleukin-18 receptor 1-like [Paralichthys olivaceus]